jgi:diguanylate cyclase (GGDEF)-like protein
MTLIMGGATAVAPAVPAMAAYGVVGLVVAVRCWRSRALDRRTRRAWGMLSLTYVLLLVYPPLFQFFPPVRFPGPGDVVRIAFTLSLAASLLTFPLRKPNGAERRKISFDVATVVLGGFIALWYMVVGPGIAASGISVDTVVAASIYPLTDLLLIFSVAGVLLRATDPSTRRPLLLLTGAGGVFIVGDFYLGYLRSHGLPIHLLNTWPLLIYLTAHFLLAAAGVQQLRQATRSQVAVREHQRVPVASRLPYAAVGLGYSLMLVAALEEERLFPWSGLVLGGVGITAVVVARQLVVQRESHRMAVTDALTGLANRAQVYETVTQALARNTQTGRSTAVVLADMNGFKQINDTWGHQAGDQILVAFASALRRGVLGSDLVARLGGDEFAIVLRDIGEIGHAESVLRRILAEIRQPVIVAGRSVPLRASFGVALCRPGEADTDTLLHRADLAMYHAKRTKTIGWSCYEPALEDGDGPALKDDLRHAVVAGQMRIHYQPIVNILDGQIRGVEALVRWEHPKRGLLPPAAFIDLAERIGVISDIGEWVLEQACRQVLQWQRTHTPPLELSVNISAHQLSDSTFAQTITAIVERAEFNPRHLVLEVTESAAVKDHAVGQLALLRDTGIRIALDDFGSGYSSLCHLTRLPVDVLKLDRSFVSELNGTPAASAVAEAVLRLGDALCLQTVAEGVEHDAQARELTLLGCHTAQGYHFARPMPPESLTALLNQSAAPLTLPAAVQGQVAQDAAGRPGCD